MALIVTQILRGGAPPISHGARLKLAVVEESSQTRGNRSAKFGGTFIALTTIMEVVMRMVIEARLEANAGGSLPLRLLEFERADGELK